MASILSRPQCVNRRHHRGGTWMDWELAWRYGSWMYIVPRMMILTRVAGKAAYSTPRFGPQTNILWVLRGNNIESVHRPWTSLDYAYNQRSWDLVLEWSHRSGFWHFVTLFGGIATKTLFQISEQLDNSQPISRDFEILQVMVMRRLYPWVNRGHVSRSQRIGLITRHSRDYVIKVYIVSAWQRKRTTWPSLI